MTHTDVRAHLRGATNVGILKGWNYFNKITQFGTETFWTITVAETNLSGVHSDRDIRDYCEMLKEASIDPIYLRGEPGV